MLAGAVMTEPVTIGFALLSLLLAVGGAGGLYIVAKVLAGYIRGMKIW